MEPAGDERTENIQGEAETMIPPAGQVAAIVALGWLGINEEATGILTVVRLKCGRAAAMRF